MGSGWGGFRGRAKALHDQSVALSDVSMEAKRVKRCGSPGTQAEQERVLLECVRASEKEADLARQENTKLVESQWAPGASASVAAAYHVVGNPSDVRAVVLDAAIKPVGIPCS